MPMTDMPSASANALDMVVSFISSPLYRFGLVVVLLPELGDVGVEDGDPLGLVDEPLGEAGEFVPGSHGGAACPGVVVVLLLVVLPVRDPLCVLLLCVVVPGVLLPAGLLRASVPSGVVADPLRVLRFGSFCAVLLAPVRPLCAEDPLAELDGVHGGLELLAGGVWLCDGLLVVVELWAKAVMESAAAKANAVDNVAICRVIAPAPLVRVMWLTKRSRCTANAVVNG
jgi:hypothetical protein